MDFDERTAHGEIVDLECGETISLGLSENPTTGYRWRIDTDPAIDIESDQFVPAANAGIGGGGRRAIVLRCSTPGEFKVRAKLWREWQGDSSVIQRCEFLLRCSR